MYTQKHCCGKKLTSPINFSHTWIHHINLKIDSSTDLFKCVSPHAVRCLTCGVALWFIWACSAILSCSTELSILLYSSQAFAISYTHIAQQHDTHTHILSYTYSLIHSLTSTVQTCKHSVSLHFSPARAHTHTLMHTHTH